MKQTITYIVFTIFAIQSFGQMSFDEIELDAIPYPKVRTYIDQQKRNSNANRIAELNPTCTEVSDFKGFYTYQRRYKVKAEISEVWSTYISASPTHSWKTRKSAVGLVYDRAYDKLSYSTDTCNGSRIGQVLYLDLRLLKGLYHLATALEITNIQSDSSIIELSYVECGVNEGKQWIRMEEDSKGHTNITHISSIKSDSPFRDKVLYPYFHNRLINAFHRKMRKTLKHNVAQSTAQYVME